jgi:hypothetical protein
MLISWRTPVRFRPLGGGSDVRGASLHPMTAADREPLPC